LTASLLSAVSLSAQTLNFQTVAPTPTANDQYNFVGSPNDGGNVSDGAVYADGAANDGFTYVANGRANMGQFFTTGANAGGYHVAAIWIRHAGYTANTDLTWFDFAAGTTPTFTFRLTDPSQVNTTGFALDTESVTVTGTEISNPDPTGVANSANGDGVWLRFGFSSVGTNILLQPNTQYGFDVMGADGDFFETLGTTNNVYSGGQAYIGTATGGVPDDTTNLLVGDRVFLVEMVGDNWAPQYSAPAITNQPANLWIPQNANAVFAPGVSGTSPFGYQWYFNTNTLLSGQTNATLTIPAVNTNTGVLGGYSVIITNNWGRVTSNVARLAVLLPSLTTNFSFSASGGAILDQNGIQTGLTTRLAGTGASISANDPNLLLDTANGVLNITSPTCDFNGQLLMDAAEAVGFNLSTIGFTGKQDFTVTGTFTNLPVGTYVNYDQVGIFAGMTSTNFVRGGLIFNSDFANLSSYGVGNQNGGDIGIATAAAPPDDMVVTIGRAAGVWSLNVNGLSVTPNASLTYLNGFADATVGVFALDTSGTHNTTTITTLSASLFGGPKLNVAKSGSNLRLTWNVVGAGLESNTNLAAGIGWVPVAGATASPYTIPVPATGQCFYRIAR
jgi:regulation of enolase protein 1 (concanavalin A-like superfamily)